VDKAIASHQATELRAKYRVYILSAKNYRLLTIAGSNPAEAFGFFGAKKNPQHAFLRRRSKAVCPMSQICGTLKNPAIYVEVGIAGQIDRPFLAQSRPSLTKVCHVPLRGVPLEMTGGTKGGAQRARTLKA
jgi:hypothetical protein